MVLGSNDVGPVALSRMMRESSTLPPKRAMESRNWSRSYSGNEGHKQARTSPSSSSCARLRTMITGDGGSADEKRGVEVVESSRGYRLEAGGYEEWSERGGVRRYARSRSRSLPSFGRPRSSCWL